MRSRNTLLPRNPGLDRMLCPHCGSESSDKARSCPSCGYKFVLETSFDAPPDTALQEKQLKQVFRAAFVFVIVAAIWWLASTRLSNRQSQTDQNPAMISQPISPGRITVNARDFLVFPFSVPAGCKEARLQGDFETVSPVELLIMDDNTFANWKNHRPATPVYNSGRQNHASINLQLAPSMTRYYFVVNNRTSARTQVIQAKLNLAYRIR
jgi:hypothetical protein